jgi:hypothetical protein
MWKRLLKDYRAKTGSRVHKEISCRVSQGSPGDLFCFSCTNVSEMLKNHGLLSGSEVGERTFGPKEVLAHWAK